MSEKLPPEIISSFRTICIDHPTTRKIIENATKVQVSEVPCLLEHREDGILLTYEGQKCWEAVSQLIQIQKNIPKKKDVGVRFAEPLDDNQIEPPINGLQGRKITSVQLNEREPDMGSANKRKPFQTLSEESNYNQRQSQTYSDPNDEEFEKYENFTGEQDDLINEQTQNLEKMGMQQSRDLPYNPRQQPQRQIQPQSPTEEEISAYTNLSNDDDFDGDPSGMGVPRESPISESKQEMKQMPVQQAPVGDRASKKSKAIKDLAAAMASAREEEAKSTDSSKIGGHAQRKSVL